ncbi:MAG: hypothetical protein AAGC96_08395 [Pseudomonadota bacterium]
MTFQTESSWIALEFEMQSIQNEINQYHQKKNSNFDPVAYGRKLAGLREKRNKIQQQMAMLSY